MRVTLDSYYYAGDIRIVWTGCCILQGKFPRLLISESASLVLIERISFLPLSVFSVNRKVKKQNHKRHKNRERRFFMFRMKAFKGEKVNAGNYSFL